MRLKKINEQSLQEYVLIKKEIANRANIETQTVIQFVLTEFQIILLIKQYFME